MARFFDVGHTTARNWLIEGICPRDGTLQKIIARLDRYGRLPDDVSPKALQVWLEKGDSYIPNPLDASPTVPERPEYDFLALYNVFALVAKVADNIDIEINSLPRESANRLLYDLSIENLATIRHNSAAKIIRDKLQAVVSERQ